MEKLRVAVIGQGRSGRDIHGKYFLSSGAELYQVVAVVDAIECRRARAKEEFGCEAYQDYTELFARNDIDLVVNASFSQQHPQITLDLLEHGFHVLVEKPFARYAAQCDEMIQSAERNNVKLMVFQQSRFAPYYTKIKRIISSGVLGRIIQINISFSGYSRRWDWQCSQRFYGGSLLNTGPHPLDQALDLMGYNGRMPDIYSKFDRVNTFGDAEDYVKIILTMPKKPLIDIEISSCDGFSDYVYKIQGSKGCLKSTMEECRYQYFNPEKEADHNLILEPLMEENGHPKYCSETLHWHEVREKVEGDVFTVGTKRYYENVYAHLTQNAPLVVTPRQIRKEIAVIEEIHKQNPLEAKY